MNTLNEVTKEIMRLQGLANSLPDRRVKVKGECDDLKVQMKSILPRYAAGLITKPEKDQAKAKLADLHDWLDGYSGAYNEIMKAIKPLRELEATHAHQSSAQRFNDGLSEMVKKARGMLNSGDDVGEIMTTLGLNQNLMDQLCQNDSELKEAWEYELRG